MAAYYRGSVKLFFGRDKNLRGYWNLLNNSLDYSDNSFHGTEKNGVLKSKKITPFLGGSYFFDGTDDHIEIPISTLVSGTNLFTIMAWVRFISPFNSDDTIFSLTDYVGVGGLLFAYTLNSLRIYKIGVAGSPLSYSYTRDEKTHLFCAVGDNVGEKLYIDGNLVASDNVNANINPPSGTPRGAIGAYPQGSTTQAWLHKGYISEVAYFIRPLSPQEIKSYYKWATGQKKLFFFPAEILNMAIIRRRLLVQ